LLPSQQILLEKNVKLTVFTLTYEQRVALCRDIFTAIYAEGEATESYKLLRTYISYFEIDFDRYTPVVSEQDDDSVFE
jgi:hypothetical protein